MSVDRSYGREIQVNVARALADMLAAADKADLPPMRWTVNVSGHSLHGQTDYPVDENTQATFEAWAQFLKLELDSPYVLGEQIRQYAYGRHEAHGRSIPVGISTIRDADMAGSTEVAPLLAVDGPWISDVLMQSSSTRHVAVWAARDYPAPPVRWRVSWLPERELSRYEAIAAMSIAAAVGTAIPEPDDRAWVDIDGWAAELGLTGAAAAALVAEPPRPASVGDVGIAGGDE